MHDQVPKVLKTPMLLALTLGIYTASNLVMPEAGLMAATVFGITVTNLRVPGATELKRTKETLVVVLNSVLFVVLTTDLDRHIWPRCPATLPC